MSIRIGSFHGTVLRVHILFPLLALVYTAGGQLAALSAGLTALLLHEAGHYFAALRLSLPVSQIELTPFGGAMQISLSDGLRGRKGFLLAAAGIAANLLTALPAAVFLFRGGASPWIAAFLASSLALAAVNLLPVLPLDGGRMLLSLFSVRWPRSAVFSRLLQAGRALAMLMMIASLISAARGFFRPFGMVMGCYLLYASGLEGRGGTARYIASLVSHRSRLEKNGVLTVQCLCAAPELPLSMLLAQLQPDAYHLVALMDANACRIERIIDEDHLFSAAMADPQALLGQLDGVSLAK